jgi:glutamate-1-semialdehyde 2,1-aminomutase
MLPAPDGLLRLCRELADRHGFLLVLDEVMTFRHGGHGLQNEWGVRPDLTTLGKIIGGGLPVGAVAGPAKVMESLAPPAAHRIHHSGTFNGNSLTMAAGLATLAAYDETAARRLDSRGDAVRSRLQETLAPHGLSVTGWGSMMNVHATPNPPACWRDVRASDRARMQEIQRRLFERGIYIAPRGLVVLSTAHSDEDLDQLEDAFTAAAAEAAGGRP